nr:hypothetical protein [Candidatus Anoxychlamydiales bacterium]
MSLLPLVSSASSPSINNTDESDSSLGPINKIPNELLLHIFGYLNFIDLKNSREVCRHFSRLIMDPQFCNATGASMGVKADTFVTLINEIKIKADNAIKIWEAIKKQSHHSIISYPDFDELKGKDKIFIITEFDKWIDTNKDIINIPELNLSNLNLKYLPSSIGNLGSLKSLNLSNNKIATLPKEIGNLSNLEHLHLENNQIATLPKEIGNLRNL